MRLGLLQGSAAPAFSSARVRAVMTTREGGASRPPFDAQNLALHVGDDPAAVAANRACLAEAMGMPTQRLVQVHGREVVRLSSADPSDPVPQADAVCCTQPGIACEIQVADCLPVLLADVQGRVVGAAHAGWRGLAGGVVEATVDAMVAASGVAPGDLEAWLGPCIGPLHFEVGSDVRAAFEASQPDARQWFKPTPRQDKWWADLPGLARARLAHIGVHRVSGNDGSASWCTVTQPSAFFSFRRDRVTGRMAAAIGITDGISGG